VAGHTYPREGRIVGVEIIAAFVVALAAMVVHRIQDRRARRQAEEAWALWEQTWDKGEG
jgi:hypothetical protein